MLTLRASAGLLRTAASVDDLTGLGAALGFDRDSAGLDERARVAFGLDASFASARVLTGPGSLRALAFAADGDHGRAQLTRAAARLATRAPHVLWTFFAVEPSTRRVLIGASTPGSRGPRVAALVVDRARVLDSDAETLRQLVASRSADDLATHARFVEVLGRDALTRRFFRKLEECVGGLAESARAGAASARREIALLYASRLLFLAFLESKGWLNDDPAYMSRAFDGAMLTGGDFHSRVLLPLFFGTLNTPPERRAARARAFGRIPFLNGGLFTPTPIERAHRSLRFSDSACGHFFGDLLARYRFTAMEETSTFEEAAIDPEMLGRAFESLMAAGSRRSSGAYYTPHELVDRVTTFALHEYFGGETPSFDRIAAVRVLDPACGSGAFLVHVLDRLSELRIAAGDRRPKDAVRRDVLARSIFGVDLNPTAVWLCQLRLWLSIVVESRDDPGAVRPLPNLDRNVRIGDSLLGPSFADAATAGGNELRRLRERYARSSGAKKATLSRQLDREERRLVIATATAALARTTARRRDLVSARRGRDLFGSRYTPTRDERKQAAALRAASLELRRRIRAVRSGASLPFSFPAHFADVAAEGGFPVIVGNPPWVRPHHLGAPLRETLRRTFFVARAAPWMAGASAAGAGKAFAAQVDLAAMFAERSLQLLSPGGVMSLLLPSKLWRSLSGGGFRQLATRDARLIRVEDHADMPATFDAAVYPGLLVAGRDRARDSDVNVAVLHRCRTPVAWRAPAASLAFDDSAGAPWLLAPPEVRRAFELVREAGIPLSGTRFGRPVLGVKCGLNDAFIVSPAGSVDGETNVVAVNGREGRVESSVLRPVIRGEQVRPWSVIASRDHVIWTHGLDGSPLPTLPPKVARWLSPYRPALLARSDVRRASRWWSLFRTESAAFDRPRVVWADIGRSVRATVLAAGDPTVPLNTCYAMRCSTLVDAHALCALLNSGLVTSWLSLVAEPARGGFRRYLGWTMSLLPVPADWTTARDRLAEAGRCAMRDGSIDPDALLDAAIAAHGLRRKDVEPLLTWAAM